MNPQFPQTARFVPTVLCFFILLLFSLPNNAQIVECPENFTYECWEQLPEPDPSLVELISFCRNASCCTNKIVPSEICEQDLTSNSCIKVVLTCITADNNCEPIFKFKVFNSCNSILKKVAFKLPNGVTMTEPAESSIYTSPCGDQWSVYLPTGNGSDAGTIKFVGNLPAMTSTCFEIKFLGLTKLPQKIQLNAKYSATDEDDFYVPTLGCGNALLENASFKVDKFRSFGCDGVGTCRIYEVDVDCPVLLSGREACEAVLIKEDDFTPPTYSFLPQNKTASCDGPIIFDTPSASDACGVVTIEQVGDLMVQGACPGDVRYIKRWRARDECFNYAGTVQQVIMVPAECCPPSSNQSQLDQGYLGLDINNIKDVPPSLDLAPNPTMGEFRLSLDGSIERATVIEIHDLSGKLIYHNDLGVTSNPTLLLSPAMLHMHPGIYLVKATMNGEVLTKKLVVQ